MPGLHHYLAASKAERWLACPGSAAAEAKYPEGESTSFASEGTQAHAVAAYKLDPNQPEVKAANAEMEDLTDAYKEFVLEIMGEKRSSINIEQKLVIQHGFLEGGHPGERPCGGTADCVLYDGETLRVIDLKYGRGVVVDAKENPQLRIYAWAAMFMYGGLLTSTVMKQQVRTYIFQPRADKFEPVRSEVLTREELSAWAATVLYPGIEAALKKNSKRCAGPHCRWCKAAGDCEEAMAEKDNRLLAALGPLPASPATGLVLPDPAKLTPEQMGKVLDSAEFFGEWVKSVEGAALLRLKNGEAIPGRKLVRKGTHRKWRDGIEAQVVELVGPGAYEPQELRSPAKLEKMVRKDDREKLKELCYFPEGDLTIAEESDKRPAVNPAATALLALNREDGFVF